MVGAQRLKPLKIPRSVFEKGINIRPRSAIKLEDPLDLPFEERPGVWVYYLMPFYEDPDRGYYRRLSSEAETLGKIVFRAECSACFWRLNHPLGSCAAFPDGIPPAVWRGRKECKSKGYFWIDEDDTEEIERWFESQHQ